MSLFGKKIINSNPKTFGLDLSDLSVKVMQIDRLHKKDVVKGYASLALPRGCMINRQIIKKKPIVESIKKVYEQAGITAERVICSLPETKAFLRIITLPKMTEEEVAEAIKWELEMNIPVSIDQVYFDWQVIEESYFVKDDKMSVLTVAITKTVVDSWMDVLTESGLEVDSLEMESIAQLRSLIPMNPTSSETVMIVDIGDRLTSFLISVRGVPVFTSSIPLSSEMMIDSIAKSLGISHDEAQKIIITHGIGSVIKDDYIYNSLKSVLDSFVMEINKSIEFFVNVLGYDSEVDRVVLCGGGSKTKGIIPYFAKKLKKNVVLGDPWVNLNFGTSVPPISRKDSVQYATVIGLAIKELL